MEGEGAIPSRSWMAKALSCPKRPGTDFCVAQLTSQVGSEP
eukprot:COSAG01_NODE_70512_length_258_cov_0.823899_1_plen_40_part_10